MEFEKKSQWNRNLSFSTLGSKIILPFGQSSMLWISEDALYSDYILMQL